MKTCIRCESPKSLSEFSKQAAKKDGYRSECKACSMERNRAYYATEEAQKKQRDWNRGDGLENKRAQSRRSYATNPNIKKCMDQFRANNPDRVKETLKQSRQRNIGKVLARNAKRHASKLLAVPCWVDMNEIEKIYMEAAERRRLGDDVHVDHIVPLQSRTVCGLHVHSNLRIISASENCSKNNRFWPQMP